MSRNGAFTLTAQRSSNACSSPSEKLSGFMSPALLMSASTRPKLSSVAPSHASADAESSASKRETSGGSANPANFAAISRGRRPASDSR